jgi:hypothetical protein
MEWNKYEIEMKMKLKSMELKCYGNEMLWTWKWNGMEIK